LPIVKRESRAARKRRTLEIVERLRGMYPDSRCSLDHADAFQLLAATVLSAQCTDALVNRVTPALFAAYPTPAALAAADPAEVEGVIRSVNYFRSKARALVGLGTLLTERFGSEVPRSVEELTALPGVGRKTANVVLNVAFGEPTIAVDTHIFRIGNRTGLAPGRTPLEVEEVLEAVVPGEFIRHAHHWLILHGRYVCKARKPDCAACIIADVCRYPAKSV
jgi:endonuclease III